MINRLFQAAYNYIRKDRQDLMELEGLVTKNNCTEVFGAIPNMPGGLDTGGIMTVDVPEGIAKGRYIQLRQFTVPYHRIRETTEKGETELTLGDSDFWGLRSVHSFRYLEEMQKTARAEDIPCLIRDLKLEFSFDGWIQDSFMSRPA